MGRLVRLGWEPKVKPLTVRMINDFGTKIICVSKTPEAQDLGSLWPLGEMRDRSPLVTYDRGTAPHRPSS